MLVKMIQDWYKLMESSHNESDPRLAMRDESLANELWQRIVRRVKKLEKASKPKRGDHHAERQGKAASIVRSDG